MDPRIEARDFIRSRRDRLTPARANLVPGGNRRVPGLRREEVAMLAAISVDYYGQIERGDLGGVSNEVLSAVARALQLDAPETAYLFDLARAIQTRGMRPPRGRDAESVSISTHHLLESMNELPAWVRNEKMDFLAANTLGYALFSPLFAGASRQVNNARFVFLNEQAHEFYPNWDYWARHLTNRLRSYAARSPYDPGLTELIGELSTRSETFRVLWAAQQVPSYTTDTGVFNHPVVGLLEFHSVGMEMLDRPGLTMFTYVPEPGSLSEERLKHLRTWVAASPDGALRPLGE